MDIKVQREDRRGYDTGGGSREISVVITVDSSLHPRQQRQVAIYETLAVLFGNNLPHELLDDATDVLMDVFDQLEPIGIQGI